MNEKNIDRLISTVNAADNVYRTGRKVVRIFMGLFFTILGVALLFWVITNYSTRIKEINAYEKTLGTVTGFTEVPETEHAGITYAPIISFEDMTKTKYTFESSVSSDPPAYKVGEKVEIVYDKNNPKDALVNTFMGKWSGMIVLFLLPLIIIPVGLWILISGFKRRTVTQSTHDINTDKNSYISIG